MNNRQANHVDRAVVGAVYMACATFVAGCGEPPPAPWSGYAEADYVYVSAPLAGTLRSLHVRGGTQVAAGAPLFELDAEAEDAAAQEAAARVTQARSQAADTQKGRRDAELAQIQAQQAQARALSDLAERDLQRKAGLARQGFIAQAQADEAAAALRQAQAREAELDAALRTARLPAREDARSAAQAQVDAAQQAERQSRWRQRQKQQDAPLQAQVADTFFNPGEYVQAGQPVLALLPPGQLKARFYVPQVDLPSLPLGQAVQVRCDGCGAPLAAQVSFVATQPEYTPPVIYSNAQRGKLVFLVEARVDPAQAGRLRPGQPVDVERATAAQAAR